MSHNITKFVLDAHGEGNKSLNLKLIAMLSLLKPTAAQCFSSMHVLHVNNNISWSAVSWTISHLFYNLCKYMKACRGEYSVQTMLSVKINQVYFICNLQTSLSRRTWLSPWEDLSIICPLPANCVCECVCTRLYVLVRACALRCPCWSAPLCFLTGMLPKVETRVVLVGEAGRNGALLKALQVFSPNPKAPGLPTVKYDQPCCVDRNC